MRINLQNMLLYLQFTLLVLLSYWEKRNWILKCCLHVLEFYHFFVLFAFLFFNFFSSANASPEFEGRGGDELGAMLAKSLEKAYNHKSAIDLESLCILPGKQCWVLYIDALVR